MVVLPATEGHAFFRAGVYARMAHAHEQAAAGIESLLVAAIHVVVVTASSIDSRNLIG